MIIAREPAITSPRVGWRPPDRNEPFLVIVAVIVATNIGIGWSVGIVWAVASSLLGLDPTMSLSASGLLSLAVFVAAVAIGVRRFDLVGAGQWAAAGCLSVVTMMVVGLWMSAVGFVALLALQALPVDGLALPGTVATREAEWVVVEEAGVAFTVPVDPMRLEGVIDGGDLGGLPTISLAVAVGDAGAMLLQISEYPPSYIDGQGPEGVWGDMTAGMAEIGYSLTGTRSTVVSGHPAIDYFGTDNNGDRIHVRQVIAGHRIVTLRAIGELGPDGPRFIESLVVKAP